MSVRPKTGYTSLSSFEERLIVAMQILSDKTRFKMFKLLMGTTKPCVSEIAETLGITLSAVSQHFRMFELAGMVDKERKGQKICYMLKEDNDLIRQLVIIASEKSKQE